MSYGQYHPYPRRFGGNKHEGKPLVQVVHESLNAQRGAAFDTDSETSVAAVETLAWARVLVFDGWEVNQRLSLQWDPRRTTDMLQRWEQIFKVRPLPSASDKERRDELELRWARFGATANHAKLTTELQSRLGDYFYAVEYIPLASAVVLSPSASYPWGTQNTLVPWYSTVGHILVRLQKPTGATEGDFYNAAGKVAPALDPIVNTFTTFAWYRAPAAGAPVSIADGPSAAGFYLDDPHNLDNNIFSV